MTHRVRPRTKARLHNKAFCVTWFQLRGSERVPIHSHECAEMLWLEKGAALHQVNGKARRVTRGTTLFIRARDIHGFETLDHDGFTMGSVSVAPRVLQSIRQRYFQTETHFFWSTSPFPFERQLTCAELELLQRSANRLRAAPNERLWIDWFMLAILGELSRKRPDPERADCPAWLLRALDGIKEQRHFILGPRQLARLAGRCPGYVSRHLKKHFGKTPRDAVNLARLEFAAKLLVETDRKILDVCLECGIESVGYFYELFNKQFGTTPRAYRARVRRPDAAAPGKAAARRSAAPDAAGGVLREKKSL